MRICILGATGLVGREAIELCERAWPNAELLLFASRDQVLDHGGRSFQVRGAEALEAQDAPRGDLALVALDDDHSRRYVPKLLDLGYRVIDKSNTYRMQPSVPLVAAGVNHSLVTDAVRLVANPNCTTIPLVLTVSRLMRQAAVVSLTVSTYQAVSGAGIVALDQFLQDAQRGYGEPDRLGLGFNPQGYAGNTVPHNGSTDSSGFSSEERKLMQETRKICAVEELPVSVQCCRVAVAVGHYMNAWIELERPLELSAVESLLQDANSASFIKFYAGQAGEGLSAVACLRDRDRALVGRARIDPADPSRRTLCLTIAGDNLRLGAATNAVRIATRWFPTSIAELQV